MAAGGDVDDRETIGHRYVDMDWVHADTELAIRRLTWHRLILETVGRDLLTFYTARDLVRCVADAMLGTQFLWDFMSLLTPFVAHQMAYEKAGILHRDISAGNILMTINRGRNLPISGFLIDWDHAVLMSLAEQHKDQCRISRAVSIYSPYLDLIDAVQSRERGDSCQPTSARIQRLHTLYWTTENRYFTSSRMRVSVTSNTMSLPKDSSVY